MSIPKGWESKNLGEVATLQRGFDLPEQDRISGIIPIVSSSGTTGFHNEWKVNPPGIVTGRYGTIGEVFFIEVNFWPLNTSLWVKDFHDNNHRYVYYLLKSLDYKKLSDKTGVPGINRNDVHKLRVVLPPLREQCRIAEILGVWDESIDLLEKLITAKHKLKQGLMQQLLTGEKRFKEFEGNKWRKGFVSDLIKSLDAGVSVNSENRHIKKNELGILKTSAVTYGTFLPDEHKAILPAETSKAVINPQKDRIIISRMNTPKLVGASVYISKDYPSLFLPDRLWQAEPKSNSFSMQWLSYVLSSDIYREKISSLATGTSNSMKNISKASILKMSISIPHKLEQEKIASVLSAADDEISTLEKQLAAYKQQKRGLMQQLLTGRIRVSIEEIDHSEPSTYEMMALADSGGSFDFWNTEPDLYDLADGEPAQ